LLEWGSVSLPILFRFDAFVFSISNQF